MIKPARPSTYNYWGLTQQRGPWKETATDKARLTTNQITGVGGGVPDGGTVHAGHATWDTLITPNQQFRIEPAMPNPSTYGQISYLIPGPPTQPLVPGRHSQNRRIDGNFLKQLKGEPTMVPPDVPPVPDAKYKSPAEQAVQDKMTHRDVRTAGPMSHQLTIEQKTEAIIDIANGKAQEELDAPASLPKLTSGSDMNFPKVAGNPTTISYKNPTKNLPRLYIETLGQLDNDIDMTTTPISSNSAMDQENWVELKDEGTSPIAEFNTDPFAALQIKEQQLMDEFARITQFNLADQNRAIRELEERYETELRARAFSERETIAQMQQYSEEEKQALKNEANRRMIEIMRENHRQLAEARRQIQQQTFNQSAFRDRPSPISISSASSHSHISIDSTSPVQIKDEKKPKEEDDDDVKFISEGKRRSPHKSDQAIALAIAEKPLGLSSIDVPQPNYPNPTYPDMSQPVEKTPVPVVPIAPPAPKPKPKVSPRQFGRKGRGMLAPKSSAATTIVRKPRPAKKASDFDTVTKKTPKNVPKRTLPLPTKKQPPRIAKKSKSYKE